jgi:hypothetical protein
MREIKTLIIHCSDTPIGRETTVKDIDQWHRERGWRRQDSYRCGFNPDLFAIGYHFVIYLDGSVHTGRHINEVGAHCSGLNSNSLGICLIGSGKYNDEQWAALADMVGRLEFTYPGVNILGHNQTPSGISQGKTCPMFDVSGWAKRHAE